MTRCPGKPINYCYIARPDLRQIGDGYKKRCPVCGFEFDPGNPPPPKTTPEQNQRVINRVHGIVWP